MKSESPVPSGRKCNVFVSQLIVFGCLMLGTSQVSFAQWNLPWEHLGGQIKSGSSPSVVALGGVRGPFSIFVRSTDDHLLFYQSLDGAYWSAPKDLGGALRSDPSCVQNSNQFDCFVLGPSGQYKTLHGFHKGTNREFVVKEEELQVWHLHYDGAKWSTWQLIPGMVSVRPSVVMGYHGDLRILSKDLDPGVLVENDFNLAKQAFNGWVRAGGSSFFGQPSCAVFASADPQPKTELIGCFARQNDDGQTLILNTFNGALMPDNTYRGGWSGWVPVPNAPKIVGDPSATSFPYQPVPFPGSVVFVDASIDVFFGSGPAGAMWHGWLTGPSTWHFEPVGGVFNSGSCARTSLPRIDCAASGGIELWHTTWLEPAPTITSFNADPVVLDEGGTTTLTWSVDHCDQRFCGVGLGQSVPGQGSYTTVASLLSVPGALTVQPKQTTTYQLVANNVYHLNTWTATVTVRVPPPPVIKYFKADPDGGYNCLGTTDTISWLVENCSSSSCNITLKGNGVGYAANVHVSAGGLPPMWQYSINPGDEVDFTLAVSSPGGSVSQKLSLIIAPPSPQCSKTKPAPLMVFYFAVTGPNGYCNLIQVAADNEPDGEKSALSFYGSGYSIKQQISANDFNSGLGCQ